MPGAQRFLAWGALEPEIRCGLGWAGLPLQERGAPGALGGWAGVVVWRLLWLDLGSQVCEFAYVSARWAQGSKCSRTFPRTLGLGPGLEAILEGVSG